MMNANTEPIPIPIAALAGRAWCEEPRSVEAGSDVGVGVGRGALSGLVTSVVGVVEGVESKDEVGSAIEETVILGTNVAEEGTVIQLEAASSVQNGRDTAFKPVADGAFVKTKAVVDGTLTL